MLSYGGVSGGEGTFGEIEAETLSPKWYTKSSPSPRPNGVK